MEIRKTTTNDIDAVMDIFPAAKRYRRARGDSTQWGSDYPARDIVAHDIARGGIIHGARDGGARIAYDCITRG